MVVEVLIALSFSIFLYIIHEKGLKLLTRWNRKLRMFTVMLYLACLHSVEIAIYAVSFLIAERWLQLGKISGKGDYEILDYLYFSATNYTSLGYGDLIPAEGLRFLATFEALVGLLLIGWSTAFAFWWMQRHWLDECEK